MTPAIRTAVDAIFTEVSASPSTKQASVFQVFSRRTMQGRWALQHVTHSTLLPSPFVQPSLPSPAQRGQLPLLSAPASLGKVILALLPLQSRERARFSRCAGFGRTRTLTLEDARSCTGPGQIGGKSFSRLLLTVQAGFLAGRPAGTLLARGTLPAADAAARYGWCGLDGADLSKPPTGARPLRCCAPRLHPRVLH